MTSQQVVELSRNEVVFKIDMLVNELNRQKKTLQENCGNGTYATVNTGLVMSRLSEMVESNTNLSMAVADHCVKTKTT